MNTNKVHYYSVNTSPICFQRSILNKHHKFIRKRPPGTLREKRSASQCSRQIAVYAKQSVCSASIHRHLNHRWCSALRCLTTRVIWYIETVKSRKTTWESYFKINHVVSLLSNTSFQHTGKHVEHISLDMFLHHKKRREGYLFTLGLIPICYQWFLEASSL